jgi:hypothetical protein
MQIRTTLGQPTQAATKPPSQTRKEAQKTFDEARETYDTYHDQFWDATSRYQNAKERNVIIGGAAGLVLGGAAMYFFGMSPSHGAELALPAIVGGGIAAAATAFVLRGEAKEIQPKLAESYQQLDSSRETFREELLKEMDDQGVRDITQPRWEKQKQAHYRQAPTLNDRIDALTNLANSRLVDGWNGELAQAQDDPLKFMNQQAFIVGNPEVQQLIEK